MVSVIDRILSESAFTAEMDVPLEQVDIGEWLFTVPDAEWQRCCPPDHIAAGTTVTEDGRRMTINVENVGTALVVQHYVAEEISPTYCRMNSISDVFTAQGRTKVNVIWELRAEAIDSNRSLYTNKVTAHPTDVFISFLEAHGGSYEDAARARQEAGGDHNRRETPLYAASIARRAKVRSHA